jgi:hypothetical protein
MHLLSACTSLHSPKMEQEIAPAPLENPIIIDNNVDFNRLDKVASVSLSATQKDEQSATQELTEAGYDQIKYIQDKATDTVAIVAADKNEIIVSIRGFDSPEDKKTAVSFSHTESAIGGEVSSGFLNTLHTKETDNGISIYDTLADTIQDFSNNASHPLPVSVSSHSMGGALSSILVAELVGNQEKEPERSFVQNIEAFVTFGSMAPGDDDFKDQYTRMCEEKNIECLAFVNESGLTPLIPPNETVGTQVYLRNGEETPENVIINPSILDAFKRVMSGDVDKAGSIEITEKGRGR